MKTLATHFHRIAIYWILPRSNPVSMPLWDDTERVLHLKSSEGLGRSLGKSSQGLWRSLELEAAEIPGAIHKSLIFRGS